MALVKGPNGLVLDVPDLTATDLVNGRTGDYELVEEKPTKATAKKSSSAKK